MRRALSRQVYEMVQGGVTTLSELNAAFPERSVPGVVGYMVEQGWLVRTGRGKLALGRVTPRWRVDSVKLAAEYSRGTLTAGLQEFLCRR